MHCLHIKISCTKDLADISVDNLSREDSNEVEKLIAAGIEEIVTANFPKFGEVLSLKKINEGVINET